MSLSVSKKFDIKNIELHRTIYNNSDYLLVTTDDEKDLNYVNDCQNKYWMQCLKDVY